MHPSVPLPVFIPRVSSQKPQRPASASPKPQAQIPETLSRRNRRRRSRLRAPRRPRALRRASAPSPWAVCVEVRVSESLRRWGSLRRDETRWFGCLRRVRSLRSFVQRRMATPKFSEDKFDAAVSYMNAIGVPREIVSSVLKNLLKSYSWEHIEADNFLVLTDAIFDDPDSSEGQKRHANERKNLDVDHSNKKLKIKHQPQKPRSKILANDKRELAEAPVWQEADKLCPQTVREGQSTGKNLHLSSSRSLIKIRENDILEDAPIDEDCSASHQDQDLQILEAPLPSYDRGYKHAYRTSGEQHAIAQKCKGVSVSHGRNMANTCSSRAIKSNDDFSTSFVVALSNSGTGKLSFSYNSTLLNRPDFCMPDMASVCKEMEARCLRKYKIPDPSFSVVKLLEDTCECIIDLGCETSGPTEKKFVQIVPAMDFLSKSSVPQVLRSNQSGFSCAPPKNTMMLGGICSSKAVPGGQSSSSNVHIIQHQPIISTKGAPHDVKDITKGEERVSIPIISGVDNGMLPPPFHYIPCNIAFQNAYINFSLARIGDESCCSDCFGDCLAQQLPCACATETGGEFAYTREGLLQEGFLNSCISMLREPHKHPHFRCKVCPNERVKIEASSDSPNAKENPGPCKGHLIRKFIKECWSKCGCTRNCGNRVVQRGITRHLQVFLTPGKKGWGLRAAEGLPPGAFICEYVGEILTNTELYERTIQKTGKAKHTYPVLLDADWVTEGVLEDEHALCLDATFYGNVARFINHRCFDGNIIGIPVEIETPDHHYYHLAFFTTKQVEPFEELTWDYGIDFDDVNHPIKAFKCRCGSEFCRDRRNISRAKSRALISL